MDLEVDRNTDGAGHSRGAIQDGSAASTMGVGVAGFGLRCRSGSRLGDGGEKSKNNGCVDGLHFARRGNSLTEMGRRRLILNGVGFTGGIMNQ